MAKLIKPILYPQPYPTVFLNHQILTLESILNRLASGLFEIHPALRYVLRSDWLL